MKKFKLDSLAYIAKNEGYAEIKTVTTKSGIKKYYVKVEGFYPKHLDFFHKVNKQTVEFIEQVLKRADCFKTEIKYNSVRQFKVLSRA